jgi:hypothetical protein
LPREPPLELEPRELLPDDDDEPRELEPDDELLGRE